MWRHCLILATLLSVTWGYGYYRDAMPNGRRIPCDPAGSLCTGFCEGFGHVTNAMAATCQGGGEHPNHYLSNFGNSWQNHGMIWTQAMCKEDSDGDGRSNGDEMGDPCCTWVTGATPSRTIDLANPALSSFSTSYPSCALQAPTITLAEGTATASSGTIIYTTPSCLCGFNLTQILPTQIANVYTKLVSNPVSNSSEILITGLEPSTMYSFQVRGYNLYGEAPLTIMIHTLAVSSSAPSAPSELKVSTATPNTLALSWKAPTTTVGGASLSDITGYELDLAPTSTGVYNTIYSGSALTYTATGLQPNTNYTLRVRGVNSQGVGQSSVSIDAHTLEYNGTSVAATYTSSDGAFHVGWAIRDKVITFEITGETLGYVAVGWGSQPTMSNTDMVVGSFDSTTGTGSVVDLWSTDRNTPAFDTIQDATFVSGTQNTTHTTITFTRSVTTNDTTQDNKIEDKKMYLVWAIGSGVVTTRSSFAVHTKRGAAEVNFFTGNTVQVNTDRLKNAHGGLAFFAWGILLPIGSFIARYKRCDMGVWWFRAHVGIQIFGSVLTFIAFIIIAAALGTTNAHFASTHAICGLIMLILTLGQNFMGFYSHLVYNPNRKKIPMFPDRVHGIIGLATLMFGFVTIFLGFEFYHVNLGAWLLGAQCLLFAVTAALVYEFFDGKEDKSD